MADLKFNRMRPIHLQINGLPLDASKRALPTSVPGAPRSPHGEATDSIPTAPRQMSLADAWTDLFRRK